LKPERRYSGKPHLEKMDQSRQRTIDVGIGETRTSRDPDVVFVVYGVGSCIVLCAHDPAAPVAGLSHILLPRRYHEQTNPRDLRYADVAIPELIRRLKKFGASEERLNVKIAGGANVVKAFSEEKQDIGLRNIREVQRILKEMNVTIASQDVGGIHSRTVRFFARSGRMVVTRTLRGRNQKIDRNYGD
jgi:chemotaxis protein CheD